MNIHTSDNENSPPAPGPRSGARVAGRARRRPAPGQCREQLMGGDVCCVPPGAHVKPPAGGATLHPVIADAPGKHAAG